MLTCKLFISFFFISSFSYWIRARGNTIIAEIRYDDVFLDIFMQNSEICY